MTPWKTVFWGIVVLLLVSALLGAITGWSVVAIPIVLSLDTLTAWRERAARITRQTWKAVKEAGK